MAAVSERVRRSLVAAALALCAVMVGNAQERPGAALDLGVGNRVSVGVDARVGWELHVRVGGIVAIRLGR